KVLTVRVDESLYFANARYLEDAIYGLVADHPAVTDVVLMCPAVNHIDASALESLEAIVERLDHAGVRFHLSEVKGPVMDKLIRVNFLDRLTGEVFLSQHAAMQELDPERTGMADAGKQPPLKIPNHRNGGSGCGAASER
ncbi:MAG: sodium-independent anion transporter, partial [Alphaproteobacteria bacterium]